jgi:Tol biopolymer transport system component
MSLIAGTRLGPYEIGAPLGAGGMGAVYRARDSRLARDVAIKVLSPNAAGDPATRQRFQREARAVAALTHPHICAIHDVGSADDRDFLVLELVDGESLAARLQRGPLPLAEALARAGEIAAAVGHAHREGVVHRDLKPANIMLTSSGVKVLDFGLARIIRGEGGPANDTTATALMLTEPGVIMGTLPYMAPEQIEGRTVDARADVFAFGAVFYEMLTARRAFDAPSHASLVAAILRDQPAPLRSLDPSLPPSVERLIETCLAKNPDDRFSTMNDVALALRWVSRDGDHVPAVERAPLSLTRRMIIGGGLALLGGAAGFAVAGRRRTPPAAPRVVVDLPFPPGFAPGPGIAVSPNGRWLALSLNPDQTLWLYDLASARFIRPAGIKTNAFYPFWSPDGQEIAYLSGPVGATETNVWRARVPDGVPTLVSEVSLLGGKAGAWLDDGSLVLAGGNTGLIKVPAAGGAPTPFVTLAPGETSLRFPTAAGRHLLFLVQRPGQPSRLEQIAADGSGRTAVPATTTFSAIADAGCLFYWRRGVVVGQRYDVGRAEFDGDPEPVALDAVARSMNIGHLQIGAGGGHVAVMNTRRATSQLAWRDRAGRSIANAGSAGAQGGFSLSPDGQRVAIARNVPDQVGRQLFIVDLESGAERRLLVSPQHIEDMLPLWSADGDRVVFRSNRGTVGNGNLYIVNADGPATVSTLIEGRISMFPAGWLRDGRVVWASDSGQGDDGIGIWVTTPGSSDRGTRYLANVPINNARLSPTESLIAYATIVTGRREVYLDSFPIPGARPIRVSRGGADSPQWRGDGRELYFVEAGRLMSVSVDGGGAPVIGTPAPLFEVGVAEAGAASYAASADGKRFLVLEDRTPASYSVKLTLNWAASLL